MPLTWDQIAELELAESYPDAIDALETRLKEIPSETESIIRLGFNLWYVVAQGMRPRANLPFEQYAARFMELFHNYENALHDNADFCWVFGQGIQMFWFYFPGATEELGTKLIGRAAELDPFWAHFWTSPSDALSAQRLKGRGIFQRYYNIS